MLALAALIRQLLPRYAFWTLLGALVYLMADGHRNASLGNFAFPRCHQGKGIMLSSLVPLVMAYGIALARRPSVAGFTRLAAAQVAALGLSSTAIWAAPVAAAFAMLAVVPLRMASLGPLALGAMASLYPLLMGLAYREETRQLLARLPEQQLPALFILPIAFVNVIWRSAAALLSMFFVMTAWMVVPTPQARRFCVRLPLLFFLLLFSPPLVGFLASNLIGGGLYYRTLWMPQIPLMVAIVLVSPVFELRHPIQRTARWVLLAFAAVYAVLIHDPHLPTVIADRVREAGYLTDVRWNIILWVILLALGALAIAREAGRRGSVLLAGGVLLLFFWTLPMVHVLNPGNALFDTHFRFGAPSLKVDPPAYRMARQINRMVEPGAAVVAPLVVTSLIPQFRHHAMPILAPPDHFSFLASYLGTDEVRFRLQLMQLAGGHGDGPFTREVVAEGYNTLARFPGFKPREKPAPVELLGQALERYPLQAICMTSPPDHGQLIELLKAKGFVGYVRDDCPGYELWVKPRPEREPAQ